MQVSLQRLFHVKRTVHFAQRAFYWTVGSETNVCKVGELFVAGISAHPYSAQSAKVLTHAKAFAINMSMNSSRSATLLLSYPTNGNRDDSHFLATFETHHSFLSLERASFLLMKGTEVQARVRPKMHYGDHDISVMDMSIRACR